MTWYIVTAIVAFFFGVVSNWHTKRFFRELNEWDFGRLERVRVAVLNAREFDNDTLNYILQIIDTEATP